jgi:hypothetical protein
VVAVVRLVGQPETALGDVEEVAVRLPVVGVDVGAEEARAASALEVAEQMGQLRDRGEGVDPLQVTLAPSASTASSSMKSAYRSPIFWAFDPGSCVLDASSSMIARTRSSERSASITNGPHAERSAGISAVASQVPFT